MTQSLTWRLGERFPPNLPPKNPPNLYENTVICDNLRTFSLNAKNPRNALKHGLLRGFINSYEI